MVILFVIVVFVVAWLATVFVLVWVLQIAGLLPLELCLVGIRVGCDFVVWFACVLLFMLVVC